MSNVSQGSAEDRSARDAARHILSRRFADLAPEQLAQLMAQVDVLAEAGLARHSDGRLDAGALAEAARLAVVVAASSGSTVRPVF